MNDQSKSSKNFIKPRRASSNEQATPLDKIIGENLRKVREENHIDAEYFSATVDITPLQLAAYEAGTKPIPASDLYLYAAILGVSIDFLFDRK